MTILISKCTFSGWSIVFEPDILELIPISWVVSSCWKIWLAWDNLNGERNNYGEQNNSIWTEL